MGRPRKNTIIPKTIEQQIDEAKDKVIAAKAEYDLAVETLQQLIDKRNAQLKDDIWNAVEKSNKSYEDILKFLQEE